MGAITGTEGVAILVNTTALRGLRAARNNAPSAYDNLLHSDLFVPKQESGADTTEEASGNAKPVAWGAKSGVTPIIGIRGLVLNFGQQAADATHRNTTNLFRQIVGTVRSMAVGGQFILDTDAETAASQRQFLASTLSGAPNQRVGFGIWIPQQYIISAAMIVTSFAQSVSYDDVIGGDFAMAAAGSVNVHQTTI